MLSFLILRLACLTSQLIHTNATCSRSFPSVAMRRQPLQGREQCRRRSRSLLMTDTFIQTRLTILQNSWLCFVLDWTPIGAALICSSGTCDRLQPEWLILTLNTVSVPLLFLREERSQRDRQSRCHFQLPVAVNGRRLRRWTGGCETLGAPCVFE